MVRLGSRGQQRDPLVRCFPPLGYSCFVEKFPGMTERKMESDGTVSVVCWCIQATVDDTWSLGALCVCAS